MSVMELNYITENLYLGDHDAACDTRMLEEKGITHILTVENKPLPRDITDSAKFSCKFVYALDMPDCDLLSQFQDCIDFINLGRESGGVLVHCLVGQSRSAAIVAAYLMSKLELTLDDAMAMVKRQRPNAGPNYGFLEQLEVFEKMGSVVDKHDPIYKTYKLGILAAKVQNQQVIDFESENLFDLHSDPSVSSAPEDGSSIYKCKKCRRQLFRGTGVLGHPLGVGEEGFRRGFKREKVKNPEVCKQSLFIVPVKWMTDDLSAQQGKINCPKCHAKLGSFSWFGERCPCSSWVVPAFHVSRSKVDECPFRHAPVKAMVTPKTVTPNSHQSADGAQSQKS